jgi:hypothetical protein
MWPTAAKTGISWWGLPLQTSPLVKRIAEKRNLALLAVSRR